MRWERCWDHGRRHRHLQGLERTAGYLLRPHRPRPCCHFQDQGWEWAWAREQFAGDSVAVDSAVEDPAVVEASWWDWALAHRRDESAESRREE